MAQFPCLPLWTDALKADTDHLSHTEFGIYIRLLILIWRTPGCRIPNDLPWIYRHLQLIDSKQQETLQALLSEFCSAGDGNWITQKRLKREFVRSFEMHGRMSDLAKRLKNKKRDPSNNRSAGDAQQETLSSLPLTPKKERKEERASGENRPEPINESPNSPRSLATALPTGALARSAQTEPLERKQPSDKNPEDLTLAEVRQRMGWS